MSRKTHIPVAVKLLTFACAAITIAVAVWLIGRTDVQGWLLPITLAALAVGFALKGSRLSRATTVSLSEFPLLVALLVLQPALAIAIGILVGAVPKGPLGMVSRAGNIVMIAVPMGLATAFREETTTGLGISHPGSAPLMWLLIAIGAVTIDTVGHYTLHGIWNRMMYGVPLREWMLDVALPCLRQDPLTALLVIALVEIGLLLDGTARALPVALAIVAVGVMWMLSQSTQRQIQSRELKDDFFRAIFVSLARLLEMKDPDTALHSAGVAIISRDIARAMGLSDEEQSRIHLAGLLHDVGKVGVPDEVLLKPGRLTPHERAVMERHVRLSAEAIQGIPGFGDLVRMVYAHHERLDGSGYPEGLYGSDVPMGARILGVADTFEALTSDRPYRKGRTKYEALEVFDREIELFDPTVVAALRVLVLSGETATTFGTFSDFSKEWSRAARHLEVRLDEEPFVLPPERPRTTRPIPTLVPPIVIDESVPAVGSSVT